MASMPGHLGLHHAALTLQPPLPYGEGRLVASILQYPLRIEC
jgi:hypothetical protein